VWGGVERELCHGQNSHVSPFSPWSLCALRPALLCSATSSPSSNVQLWLARCPVTVAWRPCSLHRDPSRPFLLAYLLLSALGGHGGFGFCLGSDGVLSLVPGRSRLLSWREVRVYLREFLYLCLLYLCILMTT